MRGSAPALRCAANPRSGFSRSELPLSRSAAAAFSCHGTPTRTSAAAGWRSAAAVCPRALLLLRDGDLGHRYRQGSPVGLITCGLVTRYISDSGRRERERDWALAGGGAIVKHFGVATNHLPSKRELRHLIPSYFRGKPQPTRSTTTTGHSAFRKFPVVRKISSGARRRYPAVPSAPVFPKTSFPLFRFPPPHSPSSATLRPPLVARTSHSRPQDPPRMTSLPPVALPPLATPTALK
ncbi:MAG: hypothetical protein BJ554DRAFT_2187 [Olpidium bornovanus]|uniref:Uncharacterized protein n=1 Tax=Olpidium bornovanus TaxID=278681 RepID=A0A8H7ZQU1_9FUNG|nr:MAG: hypothetical protein BJ554DRAFT_2187 [Olpidium bornovanus]